MLPFDEFDMSVLSGVLIIYGIILAIASVVGLVVYIFQGIGLMKMAKQLQLSHPWFAFVPVLNSYLLGKIGSQYVKKDGKKSAGFGGWMLGLELTLLAIYGGLIGYIIKFLTGIILNIGALPTEQDAITFVLIILGLALLMLGIAIAYSVITYVALWRTFAIFDNSNATAFLIVSIIFSITMPFFLFAMRNNPPCNIKQTTPEALNEPMFSNEQ